MDAVEAALWQCEYVKWSNGVMVNFSKLTGSAGSYPSSYILLNVMLHKVLHNERLNRLYFWMCQVMNSFKNKRQRSNFGIISRGECMDTSHNRVQLEPDIVMSWRRNPVFAVR